MLTYLVAALVIFCAGFLRGLTGFGFALVAAIGLGQFWPPQQITPLVLFAELALTVLLLRPDVFAEIDLRRLIPLAIGASFGVVIGTLAVNRLPASMVKPALDIAVLVSAVLALVKFSAPWLDRRPAAMITGLIFGVPAGAFAVGGPIVVVWFLAIGAAPAVIRANLIIFFGFSDAMAVIARAVTGTLTLGSLSTAAILMPVALVGAYAGARCFPLVDAVQWRRISALSIAGGAVISLLRNFW